MVITLSNADEKLYFPVNPESINYQAETYFQEYNIINKGAVKVPSGDDVSLIGWESFFPGEQLKNAPYVRNWEDPAIKHKKLENWRQNGAELKLNVTGTPFCFDVHIDSYEATVKDALGNIHYQLELSKIVSIAVETVKAKVIRTSGSSRTSNTTKKHTVKSGDCLWNISKKYYNGDPMQWRKIYNENNEIIESTAKKRGLKNSDEGHWIFIGTVLSIP